MSCGVSAECHSAVLALCRALPQMCDAEHRTCGVLLLTLYGKVASPSSFPDMTRGLALETPSLVPPLWFFSDWPLVSASGPGLADERLSSRSTTERLPSAGSLSRRFFLDTALSPLRNRQLGMRSKVPSGGFPLPSRRRYCALVGLAAVDCMDA